MDSLFGKECKFDIYDTIGDLNVPETVKQKLLYWVNEKRRGKNGRKGAANRLCKMAGLLRETKRITPEQQLQIVIFATQKEQKPSDNGIWRKLKCWLKRVFC